MGVPMWRLIQRAVAVAAMLALVIGAAPAAAQEAEHPMLPFIMDVLPENIADFNMGEDGGLLVKEVRRGSPYIKEIALTFDDGPHPHYTAKLLAILNYYRVPATFFMVGVQAERYPEWVQMVHQEGHEIGCHTYDHFRLVNLPLDEQIYQIEEFSSLINRLTGSKPRLLRPPGGQYNQFTVDLMNRNGMALGLWTINTKDTAPQADWRSIYRRVLEEVQPGAIILMHDGTDVTVEMLPVLIETLQRRGYSFVTMSQMMAHANADVLNGKNGHGDNQPKEEWRVYTY
jgi:peptidoglycan/xylan/chitin deacetylase (PgdA/CDA1 family)